MKRRDVVSSIASVGSLSLFDGLSIQKSELDDLPPNMLQKDILTDKIQITYSFPEVQDISSVVEEGEVNSLIERDYKTISVSKEKYTTESNQQRNVFTQMEEITSNNWISSVTDQLIPSNLTNEVSSIAWFVQEFTYEPDWKSTNKMGYTRHPIELLVDGVGDCDCCVTALYSILDTLGYTVGYAVLPYHIVILIPAKDVSVELVESEQSFTLDETEYVYIEPNYRKLPGVESIDTENILFYHINTNDVPRIHNIGSIDEHITENIQVLQDRFS